MPLTKQLLNVLKIIVAHQLQITAIHERSNFEKATYNMIPFI